MRSVAFLLLISGGAFASAADLSGTLTVDNEFNLYLSTDDAQLGDLIATGDNWNTPVSFNASLNPSTTYYLHLVGNNTGGPAMFIGTFNLAGGTFSNGTNSLLTNTTDWSGNLDGFGQTYTSPVDLGPSGTGPWGSFSGIDSNARFIWIDGTQAAGTNNYFTASLTTSAVPEPATTMALGMGALGLLARRRRKSG